jgi:hypothetical protein
VNFGSCWRRYFNRAPSTASVHPQLFLHCHHT